MTTGFARRFAAALIPGMLAAGCASMELGPVNRAEVWMSASAWEQKAHGGFGDFPPRLAFDGDLAPESSWRASGDGQWIQFSFGKRTRLKEIRIAFLKGDQRKYTFEVFGNACCESAGWEPLVTRRQSSGTTSGMESYPCGGADVRIVRIIGHGNTDRQFRTWNCIAEVDFVSE